MRVDTAVILCAGLGTRMRPLTDQTPKPLLKLEGKPLLAHSIDRLRQAGVRNILVNAHHLAGQVEAFLSAYQGVTLCREEALLDTGGAVAGMLERKLLPTAPFFILNGDVFWVDGPGNTLRRMAEAFAPERADALLLLARVAGALAETGNGDFLWPRDGRPRRRGERDIAPYVYAGIQIATPALFRDAPPPPFSMNLLWDRALETGRLDAMVHDGLWFHLSTPQELAHADAVLETREVGNTT